MCGEPMRGALMAVSAPAAGRMGRWLLLGLVLVGCHGTPFPIDSEDGEPPEPSGGPDARVVEYEVALLGSGEVLTSGCVAVSSADLGWKLAELIQVPVSFGVPYTVELRQKSTNVKREPEREHSYYCEGVATSGVTHAIAPACVATEDQLAHELLQVEIVDPTGEAPEPDPSGTIVRSLEGLIERYRLVSHQPGPVTLDLRSGPCESYGPGGPPTLRLLTVLEVSL